VSHRDFDCDIGGRRQHHRAVALHNAAVGCSTKLRGAGQGLRVSRGSRWAAVLLEILLRDAVEGKGSHGAFETGRDEAPLTARTAPAAKRVIVNPNHASWRGSTHVHNFFPTKHGSAVSKEHLRVRPL